MVRPTVPSVDQLRPRGSLTFLQPDPEPTTSPADLPSLDEAPDPWSSSTETSDAAADPAPSPDPTSSRASSAEQLLSKETIRELAHDLVIGAGEAAHERFARDDAARQVGLWLTDDADAENIGDPLVRIVARRDPLGAAGNPDVADAIAAAVGVAVFGWRQLQRWNAARRIRRAGRIAEDQAAADEGEQLA
jgi:hypothetical protein